MKFPVELQCCLESLSSKCKLFNWGVYGERNQTTVVIRWMNEEDKEIHWTEEVK